MCKELSEKKPTPTSYSAVAIASMVKQVAASGERDNPEDSSAGMLAQAARQIDTEQDLDVKAPADK